MDIKLKGKLHDWIKWLAVLTVALLLCCGVYYLVDTVWNGAFVRWFTKHYMVDWGGLDDGGNFHYTYEPNWPAVKQLLLTVLLLSVSIWLLVVFVVSRWQSEKAVREAVSDISVMIWRYMSYDDMDVAEVFPKAYAEISSQMAEIKANARRHEQILKEEASRKNDLIAYLAHDLKTPLTSVIGYLSLLDEVPDMPAAQKAKYVHISLDKAQRLEKLINEFFEITRYNLQQMVLETETIDLYYMLVQMSDEFYPVLQAHGNHIALHCEESVTIYGDAMKLARVFNNILKNAIAYSNPDSTIVISAWEEPPGTVILFSNQGQTISPEEQQRIFDKFYRRDEARQTNSGGAGLGLAIAKELVDLHGGTIRVMSENGRTTFKVCLPRRKMPTA